MSRIWRYVLADDNGMAPCIDQGILSLTCCKPMIRRYAKEGEWVIGFVPKRIMLGNVAWLGRIAEVILMGDYERRFSCRRDAIYRRVGTEPDGQEILTHLREDYHVNRRSSDRRGKNALTFDPFWYWGGSGIPAPDDIAKMAHYFVGQSSRCSSPEKIARLEAWAWSVAKPGIHGVPRDK